MVKISGELLVLNLKEVNDLCDLVLLEHNTSNLVRVSTTGALVGFTC